MTRRSTLPRVIDDRAFPIRVMMKNPASDFIRWWDDQVWLQDNLAAGEFAMHSRDGYGCHTMAFYFRSFDGAQRFLEAHPHRELADGTHMAEHLVEARRWAAKSEEERIALTDHYPRK